MSLLYYSYKWHFSFNYYIHLCPQTQLACFDKKNLCNKPNPLYYNINCQNVAECCGVRVQINIILFVIVNVIIHVYLNIWYCLVAIYTFINEFCTIFLIVGKTIMMFMVFLCFFLLFFLFLFTINIIEKLDCVNLEWIKYCLAFFFFLYSVLLHLQIV